MCCKSLVLHLRSAPASNTKYTSVKRWEEKDRLHMASRRRAAVLPLRGSLGKGSLGGAEEPHGFTVLWAPGTETETNVWAWGQCAGRAGRRAWWEESGNFLAILQLI